VRQPANLIKKVNEDLSLDKPLKVSKLAYRIGVILIANERVKKEIYSERARAKAEHVVICSGNSSSSLCEYANAVLEPFLHRNWLDPLHMCVTFINHFIPAVSIVLPPHISAVDFLLVILKLNLWAACISTAYLCSTSRAPLPTSLLPVQDSYQRNKYTKLWTAA
jgi:hypothetical protein